LQEVALNSAARPAAAIKAANRLKRNDSNSALDVMLRAWNHPRMIDAHSSFDGLLQVLVLDRSDDSFNMARYYVLSVQQTLFGESALVREWGRTGSRGRRRLDVYGSDAEAGEALDAWLARKVRRGYRLRP